MNFNYFVNIVNVDINYYINLTNYYKSNNKSTPTSLSFLIKKGIRPFVTFDNLTSNNKTVRCYPLSSFDIKSDADLRRKMHHFIVRYPASIAGKIVLNCPIDIPKQFITIINTEIKEAKNLPYSQRSWIERCNDEKKHCIKCYKLIQSQINEYYSLNRKDHWRYPMINKIVINNFNKQFVK